MPPQTGADLVEVGVAQLRDRIPADWQLTKRVVSLTDRRMDATLDLRTPNGERLRVVIEVKRLVEVRDVPRIKESLNKYTSQVPGAIGMVVARYLARSTRESLKEAGLSYVDASGNLLVRANSPAIFISDRGADADPWRGPGRPRGTLKGAPAAKVVRALLDFSLPWKISDLVRMSGASTGSVYRVIDFLMSEALVARDESGLISVPDWSKLLRRWSDDYQFLRSNDVTQWIAPRGLEFFLEQILKSDVSDYAVTGSVAAAEWAPYAPARLAMLYSLDIEGSASAWGLRPTNTGANVILARPRYEVVLERTVDRTDGLQLAAPTQIAVDLMTGPGRAPSEAEELVNWMERNEQSWRTLG